MPLSQGESLVERAKRNVKNIYPLSPMQEGMLFHFLADRDSTAYFQQISWRICGDFDEALFGACWNELIRRHDILRTLFVHVNTDRPLQVVLKERKIHIHSEDLRTRGAEVGDGYVRRFKADDRARSFDLGRDLLLRVSTLRLGESEYEVLISHHHIILDGWSLGLLLRELVETYCALRKREQPKLPPVRPFSTYIKWLEARDRNTSAQFWKAYVSGYEQAAVPPEVPPDTGESTTAVPHPAGLHFAIDEGTTRALGDLAVRNRVTTSTILHCIWAILLSRYNNTSDVVFGTVVSGRPPEIPGIEKMVGIFINTIAVRIRFRPETTVRGLIRQVQEDMLIGAPHHHHPLAEVQAESPLRNNLLGSVIVVENYPLEEALGDSFQRHELGFTMGESEVFEQTHYDFGIRFVPGDTLQVKIGYNPNRYSSGQIHRIQGHLMTLIRAFSGNNDDMGIEDLDILTPEESKTVLWEFNDTGAAFPLQKTVLDLFEEQVRKAPDRNAVVFETKVLTYGELNERADRVAHFLAKHHGIGPDDRIGLLLDRGEGMIIGILGAVKAGGAYVPIAPSYPTERIRFILSDSGCRVVLADSDNYERAQENFSGQVVNMASIPRSRIEEAGAITARPAGHHLAYVLYTSGSTGVPKGVMIEHRSIVNLVFGMHRRVYGRYAGRLHVAMVTPYVFDGSVQQIFSPLALGHTLFIVSEAINRDNQGFLRYLLENEIHVAGCSPNFLALLVKTPGIEKALGRLKHFLVGSEALPAYLATALVSVASHMGLTNLYGPTECCVNAASYDVGAGGRQLPVVPIGKPMPNVHIHVLDQNRKLSPIGVPGEICISGQGLARGYLNNARLTAERFVEHPFQKGKRIYLTGDRGRWLPDGNIDFMGREDDQVKIRGHRIELGEIENRLHRHPLVREAAVITRDEEGGQRTLCACIGSSARISADELRRYLEPMLPDYMIPSRFVRFEKLPVTVNGKIDRKALAACDTGETLGSDACFVAPSTDIEKKLVDVWKDILEKDRIGVQDNYFTLGGDSIKAIQLVSRLLRDDLRVEIRDVFSHPTIAQLASRVVKAESRDRDETITGKVPLTAIQERFLKENRVDPHWFNSALMLHARGGLDVDAVRLAFEAIQRHHDALRMRYYQQSGAWLQEAAPADDFPLGFESVDLGQDGNFRETIRRRADFVHRNLDLSKGPLMKVLFFRAGDGDRILIVIHHLVIDGISWRILLEDFSSGYRQAAEGRPIRLPVKTDSFHRWATAMLRYAHSASLVKEKPYWAATATGPFPVLPLDHQTGTNRYGDCRTVAAALSRQETQSLLSGVNHAYTTTTQDIVLTALMRGVHRWRGLARLPICMEGHGRGHIAEEVDVNRTVGWFTCMYPVLVELPTDRDVGYQIKAIKETLRRVPHKGIGYGILKYLTPRSRTEDLSFGPDPQVRLNYLGQFGEGPQADLFSITTDLTGTPVSPKAERTFELDISAMILNAEFELSVSYNFRHFEDEGIDEFLSLIREEMRNIIRHCQEKETQELTPGDLTYSDLSLEELEGILS